MNLALRWDQDLLKRLHPTWEAVMQGGSTQQKQYAYSQLKETLGDKDKTLQRVNNKVKEAHKLAQELREAGKADDANNMKRLAEETGNTWLLTYMKMEEYDKKGKSGEHSAKGEAGTSRKEGKEAGTSKKEEQTSPSKKEEQSTSKKGSGLKGGFFNKPKAS